MDYRLLFCDRFVIEISKFAGFAGFVFNCAAAKTVSTLILI